MKIVICQFYTPNVKYGEYSEKINRKYCEDNNYEYFVEKNEEKIRNKLSGRAWTWYKPHLIQEVFSKYSDYDYVLFLDIDAIFCNNSRRIEEFINDDFSILMTQDHGPSLVNAGVILLKINDFSKNFVNQWWEICEEFPQYKQGLWHDQTCIGLLHERLNNPNEFKIISNHDMNARDYGDHKFIFHAFAFGNFPRRTIDFIYKKKFGVVDNKVRDKIKAIVYHIFCVGEYKKIVSDQIRRLKDSGLYDWCDILEVSCIDTENKFEEIDNIFSGMTKVNIIKTNKNQYEYLGIKKAWDISQEFDGEILYFHSKGVSNQYSDIRTRSVSEWKKHSIELWKEMLEYFTIDNYEECLNHLKNKDICGVTCTDNWFWGNFWWCNLSYLRENVEPDISRDRWYYEDWLTRGRIFSYHEFYHYNYNSYFTQLPEEIYKNPELLENKELTIESAFYGTLGIQQDEGYPSEIPVVQQDVTDIVLKNFINNELNIKIDNSMFGDPIWGHKKFLLINIKIGEDKYKLVFNEGTIGNFKLPIPKNPIIKKKKILITVITCKTYNHNNALIIDRVDLTRKLDCLHTWVEDAINSDIEVLFLEGDSPNDYYDPDRLTLFLNVVDKYEEINSPSRILSKIIKGFDWILKNKDFDIIYLCDDDIYVNINEFLKTDFNYDVMLNGVLGGSGGFFSKKSAQHLVTLKENQHHNADGAIYSHMVNENSLKKNLNLISFCPQYFPGELYSTIHYVSGRRSYFLHNMLKYYRENNITNRKIILFFPLNANVDNNVITYESTQNRKTKRWYDFTQDPNGWEYHGGYTRSYMEIQTLKKFWPYAEKATKYFVINYDQVKNDLDFIINKCENSLINSKNIFLISENEIKIDGWMLDNNLKISLNLSFENLKNYHLYKKNNYE